MPHPGKRTRREKEGLWRQSKVRGTNDRHTEPKHAKADRRTNLPARVREAVRDATYKLCKGELNFEESKARQWADISSNIFYSEWKRL